MPDWTKSMQQTFEYYVVDPGTWRDSYLLNCVKSSLITRDSSAETLGSATMDITQMIGEAYVRSYLITIQNRIREKHCLGTFLVQTPSASFDGKVRNVSVDAYTPLLELKENPPPLGYTLTKGENIMDCAYTLCKDHVRAPVIKPCKDDYLFYDFVANVDDTWLSYLTDLISNADHSFDLDEFGDVLFSPKQDTASLQPVWTFDDGNSSILYHDITAEQDLYGIPNVVEVVYSNGKDYYHARVVNDDPNSPISTVNRGREITHRVTDPSLNGDPTKRQVDEYAERLLSEMSTLERSVSYTHGYCPVRLGDCVRLNYKRAGLFDVKAKVVSQTIKCEPGCPVTEKAIYTTKLWR